MSEMAKQARAALKAKAQRMGSDRPLEKVDSSSWTPPEKLNADVKTGMRPLRRRAYKAGGKVEGEAAKKRADRPARKNGGSTGEQPIIDRFMNRDYVKANEFREGKKHVGALKRGGRAEKCGGGEMKRSKHADGQAVPTPPDMPEDIRRSRTLEAMRSRDPYEMTPEQQARARSLGTPRTYSPDQRKKGGRTGKFLGGPMLQPGGMLSTNPGLSATSAPSGAMVNPNPYMPDPRLGIVSKDAMNFGSGSRGSPYKKGGKVAHGDEAADKALIRKMVKVSARTGKSGGGPKSFVPSDEEMEQKYGKQSAMDRAMAKIKETFTPENIERMRAHTRKQRAQEPGFKEYMARKGSPIDDEGNPMKKGGRAGHAKGGEVFSGKGYPFKVPGATGGRSAHAAGGAAKPKGKTDIKIFVSAGQKQPMGAPVGGGVIPAPTPDMGPAGRPVPVPPPAAAGAAPAAMPIPIPTPMPAAGGAPAPRKAGGRITKVAKSYKDMEAGAGSGEGRLQKTDIAKRAPRNDGGKVGHRSYKSYKDMDAGAGSGFGRLEKTEIAKRTA